MDLASRPKGRRLDTHKHREHTLKCVQGFAEQQEEMLKEYGEWCVKRRHVWRLWHAEHKDSNMGTRIKIVDSRGNLIASQCPDLLTFSLESLTCCLDFDTNYMHAAAALIATGAIPTAPYHATSAYTINVMEEYCLLHLNCPKLAIQLFVAYLSERHGVRQLLLPHSCTYSVFTQEHFLQYQAMQFSIAYNIYIDLHAGWTRKVEKAMHQDTPNWRLMHACPSCTYTLTGEAALQYQMFVTFDGNNSLSRMQICEEDTYDERSGHRERGATRELSIPNNTRTTSFFHELKSISGPKTAPLMFMLLLMVRGV